MGRVIRGLLILAGLAGLCLPAHAELFSAIGAIVAGTASAGAYVTVAAYAIAAASAISSVHASVQARKQAQAAAQRKAMQDLANVKDRTMTLLTSDAPWPTIYGSPAPVGGAVVAALTSGPDQQYKHVVIIFAAHECEAIDAFYINGVPVGPLDEDGFSHAAEFQTDFGQYSYPALKIKVHLSPGGVDVADEYMQGQLPGQWTADHKLSGFTYAVVTLNLYLELFQNGVPEITAKIRGKKVLDPRTGVVAYSRNPALCLADFLRSEVGYMASNDQIDQNALIAAANACDLVAYRPEDDAVDPASFGGITLYTCDGMFRSDQDRDSIRQQLEDAMVGYSLESGGVWRILAGAWSTPVLALTDADMLAPVAVLQASNAGSARFNGVRGSYVNATRNGVSEDFVPFQNPTFRAQDVTDKWMDITLAFTGAHVRTHQIARTLVEQSRGGMVVRISPKMFAWSLQPGDRILLSSTLYGIENKTFRVQDWSYSPASPVTLQCVEDEPSFYDQADETRADPAPNTNLPNPFLKPQPPLDFKIESGPEQLVLQAGTMVVRVRASWAPSTEAAVRIGGATEVQWRSTTPVGDWASVRLSGDATETFILGLAEHAEYQVRARFFTAYASSIWVMQTHSVIGKGGLPEDVDGLALSVTDAGIVARWNPPTGLDLLDWSTTRLTLGATFETSVEIFSGKATSADLGWFPAGDNRVWASHGSTSSEWSVPVSAVLAIAAPAQAVVHGEVWSSQVELAWQNCRTTQPIAHYLVKVGPSYATAELIDQTPQLRYVRSEAVAGKRLYWVVAYDVGGNAGGAGYVELSSLPSIEDAMEELREDLDGMVADLLNVNSGIAERLLDETIARGTSITHVENLVTEGNEQLAQRIDTVAARAVGYVRANLVLNGGFEFDLDGWTASAGTWSIAQDDWGASARLTAGVPAGGWFASPRFPVSPGTWYAASGDTRFNSTTGMSGLALEFFDSAGASLGATSNLQPGSHDFLNSQTRRNDLAVEATAPNGAATASVRFFWAGYTAGGMLGLRYVKAEQGRFPVTPYTSETSDRGTVAAVRQEATARATAISAEALARTTLAARVNGVEASIEQESAVRADETGKLSAKWGLKVVAGNKTAGILLNNDGQQSDLVVLVDRFAISTMDAQGAIKYPFVVGSVSGVSTVGIDGNLVVDGTITARSINVNQLSAITSRLGYVTAGQVDISGDGVGGWGYLRNAGKWYGDGQTGWLFARHQGGQTIAEIVCGDSGLQMNSGYGSFRLWGPGFNLDNGGLTISQLNVIDTFNLRGEAVTVPLSGASPGTSVTIIYNVPGPVPLSVFIMGSTFVMETAYAHIFVDGVKRWTGAGFAFSTITGGIQVVLSPGPHTLTMLGLGKDAGVAGTFIYALATRR